MSGTELSENARLLHVPHELCSRRQWVAWRYGEARASGKRAKIPIDPRMGHKASVNDPTTWGKLEDATAAVGRFGLVGVGFVFTADDPYCGVDLDDCIDPETGEIAPWALAILDDLDSYAEISPSWTGIKVWVRATLPIDKTGVRRGPVEIYQQGRFFTVTGEAYGDYAEMRDAEEPVEALYRRITSREGKGNTPQDASGPSGGFSGDDKKLSEKARNASNGWKFRALFDHGDLSLYGGDHSRADQALCEMLAFYTGRDPERMDRLFRSSALYREKKWEREDYRTATIEKACTRCTKTYTGKMPDADAEAQGRLARVLDDVRRDPWNYNGGATDRKVYRALVVTGGGAARTYRDGVVVDPTRPEIALEASVNEKTTLPRSLQRLQERGKLEILESGGRGKKAKYLLTPSSDLDHRDTPQPCEYYGAGLTTLPTHKMRGIYSPPRKAVDQNGHPTPNYVGFPEKRLPPRCGQVSDIVGELGVADFYDIAGRMGATKRHARDNLKRRYVTPLVDRGILVHEQVKGHDLYTHPHNAAERFAEYLENSGCNDGEQRQRVAIAKAQQTWELHRLGDRTFDQDYPAWVEAVMHDGPPEPEAADGYIQDLERIEEEVPEPVRLPPHLAAESRRRY